MDIFEKLSILADAAKYDVACTSSGVNRSGRPGMTGNAVAAGICHSFAADGRCISLLKVLMSNACAYDCKYCVNRVSRDTPRTSFTPRELADLTMGFYRRNYIEGLFLSSGVLRNPDYTIDMLKPLHCARRVSLQRIYSCRRRFPEPAKVGPPHGICGGSHECEY